MKIETDFKLFFIKIYSIFLLVLYLFILQSCCNNEKGNDNIYDDLDLMNNEFLGEWYAVEGMYPFGAVLKIDSNFTFNYEGGACKMSFGSKGIWNLIDDTLLLNSYESEGCYYLYEFEPEYIVIDINDSIFPKVRTTKEDCIPQLNYSYVLFVNERFIMIDSTLTHIPKFPKKDLDIRDDFTRSK